MTTSEQAATVPVVTFDYTTTEPEGTWFAKYDRMPPDLAKTLASQSDVPVDIDPVFSFPEPIR